MRREIEMTELARKIALSALLQPALATAAGGPSGGFEPPQSVVARQIYHLHELMLGVCILIAALAMFYFIVRFPKARGRGAKEFHSNAAMEVVWDLALPDRRIVLHFESGDPTRELGRNPDRIDPGQDVVGKWVVLVDADGVGDCTDRRHGADGDSGTAVHPRSTPGAAVGPKPVREPHEVLLINRVQHPG
jgi:hypothetical protein